MPPKRIRGSATRGVNPSSARQPLYDISALQECRTLSDQSAARSLLPSLPAHFEVSEQATTALHILPAATVKRIVELLDTCRRNHAGDAATPVLNPQAHFHACIAGYNVLFDCTPDSVTVRFVASDKFINAGYFTDLTLQ